MERATRVEELIKQFDWFDGVYKHDEMEEALTLREDITPRLIGILEEVADDPERYAQEDRYANVYAVALLAHFQEPAAHLPIIRAFRIPEEEREMLWGDMVTESLPALLLQTCNGQLATIKELITDKEAPEYVRGAGVSAMVYAVARDMASREEVIAFLSGLLTGTEAEADSSFWGNVVCAICDLHPEEAMEAIRKAFDDGLVDPGFVNMENVERDLADGRERMLADLRDSTNRRIPSDIHGYLSWFASFREERPIVPLRHVDRALKKQQNRKTKSRARNKLAKKARKKNRR